MKDWLKIEFWLNVKKGECWEWTGYVGTNGYGQFRTAINRTRDAHIIAYRYKKGDIPNGLCVLHHCDNRICCRPKHMFLGTRTDNAVDRNNKDRVKYGEQLPQSKLTQNQVEEIRKKAKSQTQCSLAVEYKVSFQQISRIVNYKNWR